MQIYTYEVLKRSQNSLKTEKRRQAKAIVWHIHLFALPKCYGFTFSAPRNLGLIGCKPSTSPQGEQQLTNHILTSTSAGCCQQTFCATVLNMGSIIQPGKKKTPSVIRLLGGLQAPDGD